MLNDPPQKLRRSTEAAPDADFLPVGEYVAIEVELVMCEPAVAAELYRQLTEALYPFGPAGELPTEPGPFHCADETATQQCRLTSDDVWQFLSDLGRVILEESAADTLARATLHGFRFAVRPTRKPPETP